MMNSAVAGGHSQPGARENVAYLASTERRRDFESLPASAVSGQEVCVRIIVATFVKILDKLSSYSVNA